MARKPNTKKGNSVKIILKRKGSKGGFGKWAFFEIFDPWNTKTEIKKFIESA